MYSIIGPDYVPSAFGYVSPIYPNLPKLQPRIWILDGWDTSVRIEADVWFTLHLIEGYERFPLERNAKLLENNVHFSIGNELRLFSTYFSCTLLTKGWVRRSDPRG